MSPEARPRVLLVDDEQQVTQGLGMVLRRQFDVVSASSGADGLARIEDSGPFHVIVSDMRMPGMDGAQFLARARARVPHVTRVMLSGQADLEATIAAINEGGVFRFLAKPCAPSIVRKVLQEAIEHYEQLESDRSLLRETLRHSAGVLTECLALVQPLAASQSQRIEEVVSGMLGVLAIVDTWELELASSVALLGTLGLPPEVLGLVAVGARLDPEDLSTWQSHAAIGATLLSGLPRFESVASMVAQQFVQHPASELQGPPTAWGRTVLGAELLRLAREYLSSFRRHGDSASAVHELRTSRQFPAALVDALERVPFQSLDGESTAIRAESLSPGMVLEDDLCSREGAVIAVQGTRVNDTLVRLVRNYASRDGIQEPLRVRLPGRRDDPPAIGAQEAS
ncbi:MAG: response regulator [Planctomycetota bacterium]